MTVAALYVCENALPIVTDRGFKIFRCRLTGEHPSACQAVKVTVTYPEPAGYGVGFIVDMNEFDNYVAAYRRSVKGV